MKKLISIIMAAVMSLTLIAGIADTYMPEPELTQDESERSEQIEMADETVTEADNINEPEGETEETEEQEEQEIKDGEGAPEEPEKQEIKDGEEAPEEKEISEDDTEKELEEDDEVDPKGTQDEEEPEDEPDDDPEDEPEEDQDAFVYDEQGGKLAGSVEELLEIETDTEKVIYISTDKQLTVNADARQFCAVVFEPDPEIFTQDTFMVALSLESIPNDTAIEDIKLFEAEEYCDEAEAETELPVTVYILVINTAEEEPEEEELEIKVSCDGYIGGEWSSNDVTFTLSGIPEGRDDLKYAVVYYDDDIAEMDTNVLLHDKEGVTALRFVILDDFGDMQAVSKLYTLYIDKTAPELVLYASDKKSYALCIEASDNYSEQLELSLDNGETWDLLENVLSEGMIKFGKQTKLTKGSIAVRDNAGNIAYNEETIKCGKVENKQYYGGGGGTKKEHSQNKTGNNGKTTYSSAEFSCPEDETTAFKIDERQITVSINGTDETDACMIRCVLAAWQPDDTDAAGTYGIESMHTGDICEQDDTLVLTAIKPETISEDDKCMYIWSFDGYTLKLLANSGIKYLALSDGTDLIALPTDGFTAGPDYTELKIKGTSSKKFIYSVTMYAGEHIPDEDNATYDRVTGITVSIDGKEYTILPGEDGMYAENTYTAPLDSVNYPYRAYPDMADVD